MSIGKAEKAKTVFPPRRPVRVINTRTSQKKPKRTCTRNLRPVGNFRYVDDIPYLDEVLNMHENKLQSDTICHKQKDQKTNNSDTVYLLDYGLASKYLLSTGEHREFCTDERRAHAGTVLFCSRDAHKGVPSRRSDLESLAYNMVYWLTGSLPWLDVVGQPEEVEKKKTRCFRNLKSFLELSFNNDYPKVLLEFFNYLNELQFEVCYFLVGIKCM
ncbi:hypothetical protein NQ314_002322 [Rhamnusium bicolor]|uniref:Protein kinase domain-containing protein n=1 Tax=Rhamnusium bicolor TaxID=1586634 RepID=A0AAV8ZRU6_9CUCU|nr:hypothetical protein NQ314_002322 [Rhamnusium bicolor]